MGKSGKRRKQLQKQRLLELELMAGGSAEGMVRGAGGRGKGKGGRGGQATRGLPAVAELEMATRTLSSLSRLPVSTLSSKGLTGLRKAAMALVERLTGGSGVRGRWVERASEALRERRFDDALRLMKVARESVIPKLGTMQRWVRDADFAGLKRGGAVGENWRVLDAILQTAGQPVFNACGLAPDRVTDAGRLVVYPPWSVRGLGACAYSGDELPDVAETADIRTVTVEQRWKGMREMSIYTTDAVVCPRRDPVIERHDLDFVEGAFQLTDVLSAKECASIVGIAERMGFVTDAEYAVTPETSTIEGRAASGVIWLGSTEMVDEIFRRVQPFMPQSLMGGAVAGINARFRVYRYEKGAVYRPHVDGAWPGSGVVDGEYAFDAFGDRWSRLTFVMYLNEGFEGGCTTFFAPSGEDGVIAARGIAPRLGCCQVFPHGDTTGSLVHEGSEVTQGTKYIIRTDVLYMKSKKRPRSDEVAAGAATGAATGVATNDRGKKRQALLGDADAGQ